MLQTVLDERKAGDISAYTFSRVGLDQELLANQQDRVAKESNSPPVQETAEVFGKYKPVDKKVRPVKTDLPDEFRIEREIIGDPLQGMPVLDPNPPEFVPGERYTQERKEVIDENHPGDFLWSEERKLMHDFMLKHEGGFAWQTSEAGNFKKEYFPPVKIPTVPHVPWTERSFPIAPGKQKEIYDLIREKIEAGTYEPSNGSYRGKWFCVLKKDGKVRIVHSLEPLNKVTIQHSGIPPATADVARHFMGRSCLALFDIFVGYDHRYLDPSSRDMTAFQTPFGLHRLVKLPMGWTNSVPIFHDDVTYIFKEEIPNLTIPYIDDVPVRGPQSRYELPDGSYETIKENPGIRRFVWEQFQQLNRIVQRLTYAGGTFSGKKSYLCVPQAAVVGHLCSYEGREVDPKKVEVLRTWPTPLNLSELRSFLGTAGQLRVFVQDYSKIGAPLNKLTGKVPWTWGPEQQTAFDAIKEGLANAPPLRAVNYSAEQGICLGVDTSYMAVGYYIWQENPQNPKIKNFIYFGSITLNEREARFSQPKRELYGLKLALEDAHYTVHGCRKLQVFTDASYIKGMLDNPSCGPNATVNRWIEDVRKSHFTLVHIKGISHKLADGLSRRPPTESSLRRTLPTEEELMDIDDGSPIPFTKYSADEEDTFDFEDFKHEIDYRGGYLQGVAKSLHEVEDDIQLELDAERLLASKKEEIESYSVLTASQFANVVMLPPDSDQHRTDHPYSEKHRTKTAIELDDWISHIKHYLIDPSQSHGQTKKKRQQFAKQATKFFIDPEGRLYRKNPTGSNQPLLFVPKNKRVFMLQSVHDHLGHKGVYATTALIEKRFWWPEIEKDVDWFVSSCQACQDRLLRHIRIPPRVTFTPSLFQKIHVDVFKVSPASNGCKHVVHGRCALSRWSEARALRQDNAKGIAEWFFEDIICRWGTPEEVVTDNAPQMTAVLNWLEAKYGIRGIKISAYNSQANGIIERAHFDIRQALVKATGGDLSKWYWFLKMVLYADRVTVRKDLGCSPYFIVLGAEPILPLDIVESTWLVKLPGRILTTEELIGYRAQALAKHRVHVEEMIARVDERKRKELRRFEKEHRNVIKDWDFQPGTLVQVRNTRIEKSLDRKMFPRYLGPMIVIRRTKGGAYILAEMDGSVLKEKVGAFRVLPHKARYERVTLPENIHSLIGLTPEQLSRMVQEEELGDEDWTPDRDYIFDNAPNVRTPQFDLNGELLEQDPSNPIAGQSEEEESISEEDEEEELAKGVRTRAQKKRNT
jgi:hypothetical protein